MKYIPYNKYMWLLNQLYSTSGLSRAEIDARWQRSPLNQAGERHIPESTFHHWKSVILREWGIRIEYDRSGDRYYLVEGGADGGTEFFDWMMNSLTVADVIRQSSELRHRILLEPMASGEKWLSRLIEAMRGSVVVRMYYKRFDAEEGHFLTLKPYCLKVFKQRWYVAGESSDHPHEIRVHGLDRIGELELTGKKFRFPKSFDAEAFFSEYYGVWVGTDRPVEQVSVLVSKQDAPYVRSLVRHKSQTETAIDQDGWVRFGWRLHVTYDFIMELRTFGRRLKVEKPEWLKKEI